MSITIRSVETEAELHAVYRLRYDIYKLELGFEFEADEVNRWMPEPPDSRARLLYAEDGGQVVGTLRMQIGRDGALTERDCQVYELQRFTGAVPIERMAILTRYMTRADYRDTDVPADLFDEMIRTFLREGVRLLFCDCRPHLISTYLRLGFRPYARTINEPAAGILIPLVMVLDDLPHFRRIRSRLLPLIEAHGADPEVAARVSRLLPSTSPIETLVSPQEWQDWMDVLPVLTDSTDPEVQIFENISPEEVARILEMSHVIRCSAGDRIIAHEQADHSMFILLQGSAEVRREGDVLAVLQPGSVFGEISFLLKRPRSADVYATADETEILCLRGKNVAQLIESESRTAARLLFNLSRIMAARLVGEG